jgi:hypothetical protein
MTLDSETTVEARASDGSYVSEWVDLSFTSVSSPEAYDPTNPSGTTQGNERLRNLLGISVDSVDSDVTVDYDIVNRQFRIENPDGTAFTGAVTIRAHLKGNPST